MDRVVILGSTGSIGTQTLDVLSKTKDKKILALSCYKNTQLFKKQIKKYKPKYVCVYDENSACDILNYVMKNKIDTKVFTGMDGLKSLATLEEADIIVIALVGVIGIEPTIEAIKSKKIICLANKETLVCAGSIIMPLVKKYNIDFRPIDSEHSAIWQCLQGENTSKIKKIILTGSGGPFYGKSINELKNVSKKDALHHPNWAMGQKITIDSSTMVNKGLEIIEAMHLFNVAVDKIEVLIQRESIIHSAVLFNDGSIKAQMSNPTMRIPIEYALYKENRQCINEKDLDFYKLGELHFGKADLKTFKGLNLAIKVARLGGLYPTVFTTLNDINVQKFLNDEISYLDIVNNIEKGLKKYSKLNINKNKFNVKDVLKTIKLCQYL